MVIRRVVTGVTKEGLSAIISDGPPPYTHKYVHIPGFSSSLVWATELEQKVPNDGADPVRPGASIIPGPGGTCLQFVALPPDEVFESRDFDLEAAREERRMVTPGVAELLEDDENGFHATPTVDYVIVLDGEVLLELDNGYSTVVKRGDVVVQNGTRHAWRNRTSQPVTLASVIIGARVG